MNFRKGVEQQAPRFDKNLEEFYSICDQIELHLVCPSPYQIFPFCFIENLFSENLH